MTTALIVAASLVALGPGATTASTSVRKCNSRALRYPFRAGGPKTFGVFKLRVAGGGCASAHRVAKDWMSRFEASFRAGHLRLPKAVDGFSFTNLSVHAAQTFGERGRMGHVTIWFDYVVPNG